MIDKGGRRKMKANHTFPKELWKSVDKMPNEFATDEQKEKILSILKMHNASAMFLKRAPLRLNELRLRACILIWLETNDVRTQTYNAIEVVAQEFIKGEI